MKLLLTAILCSCFAALLHAQVPVIRQNNSNLRKKTINTLLPQIQLDSLSIIPQTVYIAGVPDSTYTIDAINALLIWKSKPITDSVTVSYRVFQYKLNAVTNRLRYDSVMNFFMAKPFVFNKNEQQSADFFNFGNITYNGSFGRGISFGNAQDAVVNSNLNLQLNGFLADSIEIAAAITDNNIPIQPDGTTQQLNEFDRIFLQFKKKNWQLNLGDIDIRANKNYFLQFYKRLQGASFETNQTFSKNISNQTLFSGSIAKGKFTRNIFQGLEGNQGPYRMEGANNEFFFVILAGTERVFIDGQMLQRGEDQDYVINYNTAEITFTPKRMISKDSRIQVEFEYADRNYLNANFYLANTTQFGKKLTLRAAAFSNSDAKNATINQTLDANQKSFLSLIGDSIQKAYYPAAVLDSFSVGNILYKKTDTLYNSSRDSIFVYSTNPDSARYSLSFIEVGQGNGHYVPDFNGANGKVYKWVQPINGIPQGNYEAASFLVTPKKQQVVTIGADYLVNDNTIIQTDFGYSNYDINRFSVKDKKNDKGYAFKIQLKNKTSLKKSVNPLQLVTDMGIEWVDKNFKPLERLRNVEFSRDWSVQPQNIAEDELLYHAGFQLSDKKNNSIQYQLNGYKRGNDFNGIRNSIIQHQNWKGWQFNNQLIYTVSNSAIFKSTFLRPTIDLSKELKKLNQYITGMSYSVENNTTRNKFSDTIAATSFAFDVLQFYLKSNPSKYNKWGLSYYTRSDKYPSGKQLIRKDRSQNFNIYTELLQNEKHQFKLNATYRKLNVIDKGISNLKDDESLLARAEYNFNEWRGLVTGNVLYEIGAGQEQKRDYSYLEVPAGQGQFTWIDYNNDGIQQLNEFEWALFTDQAKYIRIFTPTNQFIKANYNTFNYSISLNPRSLIDPYRAKGMKKIASSINIQSSLQLSKKEIATGVTQFNPFAGALNDTSLINLNAIFINTLSINRFSTKWGIDFNNTRNSNKTLLTYGLESRRLNEWSMRTRWNLNRSITFDILLKNGTSLLTTENAKFENRNYYLNIHSIEPRISFIKGAAFRLVTGYKFNEKNNTLQAKESYSAHSINTEMKYNVLQNTSLQSKFTFSNISFTGASNTTVSYIMLDGLMPGKNYLWNIDFTRRLGNSLELNIQYEGRKPGDTKVIHIGRASIRAIL